MPELKLFGCQGELSSGMTQWTEFYKDERETETKAKEITS
jgi:hypothetical protein